MREDWISILETAYDLSGTDEHWLGAVAEAARPQLDCGLGVVGYFYDASAVRLKLFGYVRSGATEVQVEFARRVHAHPAWRSSELLRATYRAPSALTYSSDMGKKQWSALLSSVGDCGENTPNRVLILHASDPSNVGCVLGAPELRPTRNMLKRKHSWTRVAVHVASGLRLRRRLARYQDPSHAEEAILSPSGTVVHASGPAKPHTARDALRNATIAVEKARGRLRRTDPDAALDLWRGLLDGRWSLIDRFDTDGRRFVVAHRNDVAARGLRALTPRERQVASYAALAHSNKLIAYELGLSLGCVSAHLGSALAKLGIRSRVELIELASNLGTGRRTD